MPDLQFDYQEVKQAMNGSSSNTGPSDREVLAQSPKILDICEIQKWDKKASLFHKFCFSSDRNYIMNLNMKISKSFSISLVSKDKKDKKLEEHQTPTTI